MVPLFVYASFSSIGGSNSMEANLQTMKLLTPTPSSVQPGGTGGGDIIIENGEALSTVSGPEGTAADVKYIPNRDEISLYVVRAGDTLGSIAEMFDIRANTLRWANDIGPTESIHIDDVLLVLPIDGTYYEIKKGDTLASVAKKYGGDVEEIAQFNGISAEEELAIGTEIIIPGGELQSSGKKTASKVTSSQGNGTTCSNSYVKAWGGPMTQDFHDGFRARDFGIPIGSTVGAAAEGTVIAVKSPQAWNGGYGGTVILKHAHGAQTLYAHLSKITVEVGQHVDQSETIALSGSTGRSTGPHMHFEIRSDCDIPFK